MLGFRGADILAHLAFGMELEQLGTCAILFAFFDVKSTVNLGSFTWYPMML